MSDVYKDDYKCSILKLYTYPKVLIKADINNKHKENGNTIPQSRYSNCFIWANVKPNKAIILIAAGRVFHSEEPTRAKA